jgi:hypothetical protein
MTLMTCNDHIIDLIPKSNLGTKILRVLFWNSDVSNHDHCCLLTRDGVWSGRSIPDFQVNMFHHNLRTVMMEAVGYSEKPVQFHQFTWLHIPQHEIYRNYFFVNIVTLLPFKLSCCDDQDLTFFSILALIFSGDNAVELFRAQQLFASCTTRLNK